MADPTPPTPPAPTPPPKLTEAQKAEAAAEAAGHVRMFKDGVTTYVHPTCVKAHEQAFWKAV